MNLPHPLQPSHTYLGEFECICKGCRNESDHMHSWIWSCCDICHNRIWFNMRDCTLYAWRYPKLICFNCRLPYYEKGISSGDIHRQLLK